MNSCTRNCSSYGKWVFSHIKKIAREFASGALIGWIIASIVGSATAKLNCYGSVFDCAETYKYLIPIAAITSLVPIIGTVTGAGLLPAYVSSFTAGIYVFNQHEETLDTVIKACLLAAAAGGLLEVVGGVVQKNCPLRPNIAQLVQSRWLL